MSTHSNSSHPLPTNLWNESRPGPRTMAVVPNASPSAHQRWKDFWTLPSQTGFRLLDFLVRRLPPVRRLQMELDAAVEHHDHCMQTIDRALGQPRTHGDLLSSLVDEIGKLRRGTTRQNTPTDFANDPQLASLVETVCNMDTPVDGVELTLAEKQACERFEEGQKKLMDIITQSMSAKEHMV